MQSVIIFGEIAKIISVFDVCYPQAKMKKMKEKYKDQDDEERQLRMEILAVSLETLCFL